MNILVTGGAGYIGSHVIVALSEAGHSVYCIDNLSNSSEAIIPRMEKITSRTIPFNTIDLLDKKALDNLFASNHFDAVIHCAGLKAVGESSKNPLTYYEVNVGGAMNLLDTMQHHGVHRLVFSSSATVYGSAPVPYKEEYPTGRDLTNPYGRTKYVVEQLLEDLARSDEKWQFSILRYFNPIGAHPSGQIGEQPQGTPANLMPYLAQVAVGIREMLTVYGDDYPTPDGTGVRDYVHVMDLASGHLAALEHLHSGIGIYNLGTGKGTSVLELLHAFEHASNREIPYEVAARRSGDLPSYYADVHKAESELGWKAVYTVEDACQDSWRWQSQNPHGYSE